MEAGLLIVLETPCRHMSTSLMDQRLIEACSYNIETVGYAKGFILRCVCVCKVYSQLVMVRFFSLPLSLAKAMRYPPMT